MSLAVILLIILSAFIHVGWNLLSKGHQPSASFFLVACLTGALLLSPSLSLYRDAAAHIPFRVWEILLISGFFQALYYTSLAGAYRYGDISVAYPIARSTPVIVVSIATLILGRGNQISDLCIAGIFLVMGGCFLVPRQRFSDLDIGDYFNPTCGLALLAAAGSAGYTMLDDEALRRLGLDAQISIGKPQTALLYACLEALAASLWLFLFVALRHGGLSNVRSVFRHAVLAGAGIHITYLIILISLTFASNVTYVVGFRQISVPLGTTLGIIVLKEAPHPPKIAGVTIMFFGLMMIAMG